MKTTPKYILPGFAAAGILLFTLDSPTVIASAKEAVLLCGQAIIPSLFPMFFLCILLTGNVQVTNINPLKALGKWFGLSPSNTPLLLACFLGGYPAGAQGIGQIYHNGGISKDHATRILACCNQAGPAFIFGILADQFQSGIAPWALWAVQIVSTTLLWLLFHSTDSGKIQPQTERKTSPSDALSAAITAIARVCGWVILFRCMIGYMNKLFLYTWYTEWQILIAGLLELTNGSILLSQVEDEAMRFILCSVLLTFGGICVTFQTKSVVGNLSILPYINGKILQTLITFVLSTAVSAAIYRTDYPFLLWITVLSSITIVCIYAINEKKTVAFHRNKVYNNP